MTPALASGLASAGAALPAAVAFLASAAFSSLDLSSSFSASIFYWKGVGSATIEASVVPLAQVASIVFGNPLSGNCS